MVLKEGLPTAVNQQANLVERVIRADSYTIKEEPNRANLTFDTHVFFYVRDWLGRKEMSSFVRGVEYIIEIFPDSPQT